MSELSEAINEMRNMRESYDQIGAAADAYNTGKAELAANITAKGVQASATETLPELAEKVNAISQETFEINGGEMYAKQLFGVANNDIVPGYWNLYDILAQLLSDGRLVNYGGILLAEYYKGYDSLALAGAGAGGAYVVSDKDSDGNFIMYTNDTTHTWATEDDGKGNRWVAYCFADAGHGFDITDTNTSPRTIHIGRNVGTIKLLANTRTSQIIVTDGNVLGNYNANAHTSTWQQFVVLRNIGNIANYIFYFTNDNTVASEKVYVEADTISGSIMGGAAYYRWNSLKSLIIKAKQITGNICGNILLQNLKELIVAGVESGTVKLANTNVGAYTGLSSLYITDSDCNIYYSPVIDDNDLPSTCKIYFGYKTNEGSAGFSASSVNGWRNIEDLQLQEGWCKNLNASLLIALTEANMYAHILQKLKQDEADCGDGVRIMLGATNLAKLTSEESVAILDSLTNVYGYTFA